MRTLTAVLLLACVAGPLAADEITDAALGDRMQSREAIENGKLLYGIYCKSCHGGEGRGDGETARSLKTRPTDLTRLSRSNDGEFPLARVILSIDGRNHVPGHMDGPMPIWGLSLQESGSDTNQEGQVRGKILHLIEYLKSIQSGRRAR